MDNMLFAGIDLHKTQFTVCVLKGNQTIEDNIKYETRAEGYNAFITRMNQISEHNPKQVRLAIESTSNSRYFKEMMEKHGFNVTVVNTLRFKVVNYAKYTKAADAKLATDSNNLYIGAETKAFELAEGMTAQAAANFLLVGTKTGDETKYDSKAGAGLKFNFKNEESKIKAGVAADVSYDNKTISFDVLATGSYDFVSAKAYFGFAKAEDADPEMALELSASAKYKVNDDVTVTGSVEANRLLNVKNESKYHFNKAWAGFTVKAGATVKEFTVDAYFNYNQLIDHLVGADADIFGMNAGLDVTYKAEKFTAKAGAALNFTENAADAEITPYAVKPTASISTDAIVENCTLALSWAGARFVLDKDYKAALEGSNGAITASATIAFK